MNTTDPSFQETYEAYHARILRYLTRFVGESEAEDLAQDTFVKVSRGLGEFRGEAQLKTWIYRIATNAAIDRLRNAAYRQGASAESIEAFEGASEADESEPGGAAMFLSEQTSPVEQAVTRVEMNECIRSFIAELPESYRAVLVLGDLEGLTNPEVAEVLGLTLDTVKIRLHRARKKLRAALEMRCGSYWVEDNEFVPDLRNAPAATSGGA